MDFANPLEVWHVCNMALVYLASLLLVVFGIFTILSGECRTDAVVGVSLVVIGLLQWYFAYYAAMFYMAVETLGLILLLATAVGDIAEPRRGG